MKYSNNNILLIDDDEVFHFIARDFIETRYPNLNLTIMQRADDALVHLKKLNNHEFPQLIIVDMEMPVMDGVEFLEIYEMDFYPENREVPVIILSNSESPRQVYKLDAFKSYRENILKSELKDKFTYIIDKYLNQPGQN